MSTSHTVAVVLIFLRDGLVTVYHKSEMRGQGYDSGELLFESRSSKCKPEASIVLGAGGKSNSPAGRICSHEYRKTVV